MVMNKDANYNGKYNYLGYLLERYTINYVLCTSYNDEKNKNNTIGKVSKLYVHR